MAGLLLSATSRLSAEQAAEPEVVTRAEGISVSDAVREAIAEHSERKRKDEAFRERLRTVVERDREILERLAGWPARDDPPTGRPGVSCPDGP